MKSGMTVFNDQGAFFSRTAFNFSEMSVLLTGAPLFCRDHDAAALLDFFLIMCDPSPLIP